MGSFAEYYGDKTIPEEKREEFTQRVLTLLTQGGAMSYEEATLFGGTLPLLTPPKLDSEGCFPFNYNYFEDDFWEDCCYDANTCAFYSEKIGFREFSRVACAVYVLYEFYVSGFGVTFRDRDLYGAYETIGWLNYLFHENYTNARLKDPEAILSVLPERMREDERVEKQVRDMCGRLDGSAFPPAPPLDTPAFLWFPDNSLLYFKKNYGVWNYHMTDDDRLLFWREGGDVKLSPRVYWWLRSLVREYWEIMEDREQAIAPENFLRVFWDTLQEVNRTYLRIYPQRDMFYDFIAHSQAREVQAAVILLQRLSQRYKEAIEPVYAEGVDWDIASPNQTFNPARLVLKRYLAVLGNPELRRQFFGF